MGSGVNCLWIGSPLNDEPAKPGNGVNVALLASNPEQVNSFYNDALQSGGVDDGAPGLRDVHPHFYADHILDPIGNKLVVVCHSSPVNDEK